MSASGPYVGQFLNKISSEYGLNCIFKNATKTRKNSGKRRALENL
jgi:hypothetical protein